MNHAKSNSITMLLLVCFLPIACLLTGCGPNLHQLYQETERMGTIAAYEEYLQKYPDSPYSIQARNRISAITFEEEYAKAVKAATPEAMAALLKRYPGNPRLQEGIKYKMAQQAGTRRAYEEYLMAYPNGQWAREAVDRLADIMDPEMKKNYERAGRDLAASWVALLDEGRWSEASGLAEYGEGKPFGSRQDLEDFLCSVRQAGNGVWLREARGIYRETGAQLPLRIVSRKVPSARYSVRYGKRPLGDYVVVIFETVFDRARAKETIVAVRMSSGKWRNDGYLIDLQR